jgi:hypothetical protein
MSSWEDPLGDIPPYVKCAQDFALYLSNRSSELSNKDLAQAIWACGRLKICDTDILYSLAVATTTAGIKFNSQEIANILWGLAKADFHKFVPDHGEILSKLSKRTRDQHILDSCSAQEASNILYALAKMNAADEETFSAMTRVIVSQLADATAQTIANALWAHESAHLKPPRAMLDLWAKEKLDITGLYIDHK